MASYNISRMNSIRYGCFTMMVILLLATGTGCSKNGTTVNESSETIVSFLALTADSMQLGLKIDGEIKINDLKTPADLSKTVTIHYFNKEKRMTVFDVATGQVLLDSVYIVNTHNVTLGFYQKTSNGPVMLAVPPPGAPPPPVRYSKISVVYTLPGLPDEVKVVVENTTETSGPNGYQYVATDSFLLKKGEFSPYFLGWNQDRTPRLKIYTPGSDRILLAKAEANQFADLVTPYVIYGIRKHGNFNNGVYDLLTQKLY